MSIVKAAYNAIETVVGSKYISDDPAICEGYRSGPGGYESGLGYERIMTTIPHAVAMPRTTEEVQKIGLDVWIGVLLHDQGRRGVPAPDCQQPNAHDSLFRDPGSD